MVRCSRLTHLSRYSALRECLAIPQSLETSVGRDAVVALEDRLGSDDLVVGAALAGHAFKGGETLELTGITTPWNTLAVWDVSKLSKLG